MSSLWDAADAAAGWRV